MSARSESRAVHPVEWAGKSREPVSDRHLDWLSGRSLAANWPIGCSSNCFAEFGGYIIQGFIYAHFEQTNKHFLSCNSAETSFSSFEFWQKFLN